MSNNLKCKNCAYWWAEDGWNEAMCHFIGPAGEAPCEVEEVETPEDYYG